ncbi:MAG TPA: hypothetical protein VM925_12585 [Labilithrix sp.]|jgi:CheY-like chemotaxis protein|nr:hypothetical protein [Labilithrix sp.]
MHRTVPLLLVVDDDLGAAEQLASWLLTQGFNAVSAASCLEARAVMEAVPIDGLIGHLGLRDASLFGLAQTLRAQRQAAVIVGYADVDVRPPPELDACFVRPLDLEVLGSFLSSRFGRHAASDHFKVANRHHSVPPAAMPAAPRRKR